MKFGKVWGETEVIVESGFVHIHRISILPNSRCSEHEHHFKPNGFHVFSGTLKIVVKKNDYALTDTTVLGPGDSTNVEPTEFHYFETGTEPVEAIEWYTPQPLRAADIRRQNVGSRQE